MRFIPSHAAILMLAAALLSGCTTLQSRFEQPLNVAPEIIRSSVRFQKEYLLTEGDQIEVSVWRTPEVSRTVFIRPDGNISLPLMQETRAAGLTPRELADKVQLALSNRLVKPEVNVIPMTVRQPMVYVLGDARTPGAFPLRTAATAAQAIALAGGTLRSANEDKITVIRLSGEGYLEAFPLNGASPSNVPFSGPSPFMSMAATQLKADDIVFIPESGRSEASRAVTDLLAPFTIYLNYKLLQRVY